MTEQMSAGRSAAYIFQGVMYFYRPARIYCRYQFKMQDQVEPELLQQALDSVLARADYCRQRLVWEGRDAFLEPNDQPCTVARSAAWRKIPEETNGYLFSLSCEGDKICMDWDHFLMDGRGMSRMVTQVLQEYTNRRYGTEFACPKLSCSPPYDVEALLDRFPSCRTKNDMQGQTIQTYEGECRRAILRLEKAGLVRRALDCRVKPFTCLTALLCRGLQQYLGKDTVTYSYSVDTRAAIGAPDAMYNCVASFQGQAELAGDPALAEYAGKMDAEIRSSLEPEHQLYRMAQQMSWVYEVTKLKAPLKIKSRVFQMGEYISGIPADFWISYLGDPIVPASGELMQYIKGFEVWVPPDGASLGFEVGSVNGEIILCIQDKTARSGLPEILRKVMEQEGIPVFQAEDLG